MDNYKKYLKYKYKYQKLKNKLGGSGEDNLDVPTKKFIDHVEKLNLPSLDQIPLNLTRLYSKISNPPANIPVNVMDTKILDISVRILRPINNVNTLPVIIYYHGGGGVLGNVNTHDRLIKQLCIQTNAVIVFVNYSLAPEAKFPVQIIQCYEIANYVYNNPLEFNINKDNLVLCGDSAGGNLAIGVTLLAKQNKSFKIKHQVLLYPATSSDLNSPSYHEFADAPLLNKRSMEFFRKSYMDNPQDGNNILISPIKATIEQLKDLPPSLFIIPENDPLRDDTEAYAHKLMQAGNTVSAMRILGTIHGFLTIKALKDDPVTKTCISIIVTQLKTIFEN